MNEVYDGLMKLDSFTRKQIINEFEGVLHIKPIIDTASIEHFTPRSFSANQFYGAFLLVIAIIFVIGAVI